MDKKILVIIPAYNESFSIVNVIKSIKSISTYIDILVINDCSIDNTEELARSVESTIVLNLPINMGIGGAIQTGFKYAANKNYDIIVRMDGDGQHDPKYVLDLIKTMLNGKNDIVIGSRFINKKGFQSSFVRRFGKTILQFFIYLITKQVISDSTSGFRAYSARAVKIFCKKYPDDYPEPEEVIIAKKNRLKVIEIPVEMRSRDYGKSSIKGLNSIYYMIKVIIASLIESIRSSNG